MGLWMIFLFVLMMVVNFGGLCIIGWIGVVMVWGVIILVVVVLLIGWFWFSGVIWGVVWNLYDMLFGVVVGSLIVVMLWVFFGFELVCVNLDVVENLECNVLIVVFGGMIVLVIFYIVLINVIVGIVFNVIFVKLNVLFGIVFVMMFMLIVGMIVIVLMVIVCIGLLFGW